MGKIDRIRNIERFVVSTHGYIHTLIISNDL